MRKLALVFAGGFCGTLTRYFLAAPFLALVASLFPHAPTHLPYDIFIINITGAFALGLLYGIAEQNSRISPETRLLIGTGFLGAYTTFSTFTYGGDTLLSGSQWLLGLLYLAGGLALGVFSVQLGQIAARLIMYRRHISMRAQASARGVWRQSASVQGIAMQPWRLSRRKARRHTGAHSQSQSAVHTPIEQRNHELPPEEELI